MLEINGFRHRSCHGVFLAYGSEGRKPAEAFYDGASAARERNMDGNPKDDHKVAREAEEGLKKRGLSRRGVLNIVKHIGVGIGAAVIVGRDAIVAFAQQVTGVLGSPSATTTINGKPTPAAAAEIRRRDQGKRQGFQALVAAARRAAQGRAQRAAHHDRRPGLWRQRHVRRRHPDAGAGPDRECGTALHRVPLHRALLAHAGRADHRPQPSLGGLRRDRGAVDGLPRL